MRGEVEVHIHLVLVPGLTTCVSPGDGTFENLVGEVTGDGPVRMGPTGWNDYYGRAPRGFPGPRVAGTYALSISTWWFEARVGSRTEWPVVVPVVGGVALFFAFTRGWVVGPGVRTTPLGTTVVATEWPLVNGSIAVLGRPPG